MTLSSKKKLNFVNEASRKRTKVMHPSLKSCAKKYDTPMARSKNKVEKHKKKKTYV